jgi:hypothetical protein
MVWIHCKIGPAIVEYINLIWIASSSGIWRRVVRRVSTDVSEEHIASIFRVEEIGSANQRASRWQAECSASRKSGIYGEQRVSRRLELGSHWPVLRQNKTANTYGLNPWTNRKQAPECVVLKRAVSVAAVSSQVTLRGRGKQHRSAGPWYVPSKRRLKLNGLHLVISQMILFITTSVKTSNPTLI